MITSTKQMWANVIQSTLETNELSQLKEINTGCTSLTLTLPSYQSILTITSWWFDFTAGVFLKIFVFCKVDSSDVSLFKSCQSWYLVTILLTKSVNFARISISLTQIGPDLTVACSGDWKYWKSYWEAITFEQGYPSVLKNWAHYKMAIKVVRPCCTLKSTFKNKGLKDRLKERFDIF